ncbi:hypothetical protein AWC26_01795 [Mycobacterium shimoidei]|uniref:DUF7159 family protein n=1 Tax=Mycobacterium shimoidei TaxID=29313 RepID=UPI000848D2D2|nr:hypothetical protein [Mycobacterium shimoidei]ODR12763.1 hypothetical protein BHQ16_13875 [Mycobacterium shimoidei]ORW83487.1 hypothetical protein AWC26_01795 [Mycobacterium shimoidei]
MDIVLGVSLAPTTIRLVLVEGENADGVTVEEDDFDVANDEAPTVSAADQVIAAILGTREGAAASGHQLASTGVTWTDPTDAAALRDALAAHKVENVMLVSAFLASAALAQSVGNALGYEHTAMLFVEPDTATLGVVDGRDGSVSDVYRRPLRGDNLVAELATMISDLDNVGTRPDGLFMVGCGVDVAAIKPALEATIGLRINAAEEPETALARGAALASANAPLFASSTAALAYAQDPGTGQVTPGAVVSGYLEGDSADDDAESEVVSEDGDLDETGPARRPMLLIGSMLAVVFVTAALALEVALTLGIRPAAVGLLPMPVQRLLIPTEEAPVPPVSAPTPPAIHMTAPAAPPPAPPVQVAAPQLPAAPAPVPPPPAAPPPVPVPAAPVPAPVPVPIPIHVPIPGPVGEPVRQPPVHIPQPPAHVPHPPAHAPTPPAQAPRPPIHLPTPPAQAPKPPIDLPTPPAQAPRPPIHLPTPPVQAPRPPVDLPTPRPPLNLPAPRPPIQLPAPRPPTMPSPQMPQIPAMPRLPSMPAPAAPRMPSMPAPALPHFKLPMPSFHF